MSMRKVYLRGAGGNDPADATKDDPMTHTEVICAWADKALTIIPVANFHDSRRVRLAAVRAAFLIAGATKVAEGGAGDAGEFGHVFYVTGRTGAVERLVLDAGSAVYVSSQDGHAGDF